MKAFTIWQPWASLIVHGLKPFEWRSWACPAAVIGQRLVIHAGRRDPLIGIKRLLATRNAIEASCGPGCDVAGVQASLERMMRQRHNIPTGAGVGTAVMGKPISAGELYGQLDARVGDGRWCTGWPMLEPHAWTQPVEAKGAQGFWTWPHTIEEPTT